MEEKVNLDIKNLRKLDKKTLQKVLQQISKEAERLLKKNIAEVYLINSQIRIKGNYVPLEEMLDAVKIDFDNKNLSFSIGIDEDLIEWKDKFGEDIYEVETNQEEQVSSLKEHWKTPIRGVKEDDWFLNKTVEELSSFIKKNFNKLI